MCVYVCSPQLLLSELLFAQPADPVTALVKRLERIKVAGTRPLLDVDDLATSACDGTHQPTPCLHVWCHAV
jgi:hypothetical protein